MCIKFNSIVWMYLFLEVSLPSCPFIFSHVCSWSLFICFPVRFSHKGAPRGLTQSNSIQMQNCVFNRLIWCLASLWQHMTRLQCHAVSKLVRKLGIKTMHNKLYYHFNQTQWQRKRQFLFEYSGHVFHFRSTLAATPSAWNSAFCDLVTINVSILRLSLSFALIMAHAETRKLCRWTNTNRCCQPFGIGQINIRSAVCVPYWPSTNLFASSEVCRWRHRMSAGMMVKRCCLSARHRNNKQCYCEYGQTVRTA